jgi:DNA-binding transcriptional regulator YdaS (Cro superfamily)
MSKEALERAIKLLGGQVPLAKKIKRTQQHISWALRSERGKISGKDAIKIERATNGAVRRAELRPDIFAQDAQSEISPTVAETIPAKSEQIKAIQR